uniref:AMP-binding domain-containing protein n=1 Tax=Steinernema glaseri TaxID=37863 RepID=A0A1I8A4K2_9BILA
MPSLTKLTSWDVLICCNRFCTNITLLSEKPVFQPRNVHEVGRDLRLINLSSNRYFKLGATVASTFQTTYFAVCFHDMIFKSDHPDVAYSKLPYGTSILNALWKYSVTFPGKLALINAHDESDSVTYQELYVNCLSVAAFLKERHFGHGDVAAACMPNRWEFFPIFCGVALRGGALSGASYQFTEFELERQFKDCNCKVVFCSQDTFEKVLGATKRCPSIRTIVVLGTSLSDKLKNYGPGIVSFRDVIACAPSIPVHDSDIDTTRDIVFLPYSRHVLYAEFALTLSSLGYGMTEITLACTLPVHGETQEIGNVGKVVPNFDLKVVDTNTGKSLGPEEKGEICVRGPSRMLGYLNRPQATAEVIDDNGWLRTGDIGYVDKSGFLFIVDRLKELIKVKGLQLKVVDTSTGKSLGPEEKGEICVRGPSRMLGYLNRPQATAEVIDDSGWLRTGDIGYVDKSGFLFIVDRLKELIKVKGLQVPPAELEDVLLAHPMIKDAAVIGIPHDKDGEQPMAFVVRATESLCEEDVKKFVAERLARYKHLTGGVQFLSQIPKSPSGKILRRFLRDEATLIHKISDL